MFTRQMPSVLILALIFAAGLAMPCIAEIHVGLSQVDITPPIGGLTTGYSSAKPTDAIHDPVSARVLVLQNELTCIALVVCDLCVYNSPSLHAQMKSIGVDRLLLMNTHTHAGPKMNQDDFPTTDKPWRDTVDERLLTAIKDAKRNQFKAFFVASESHIQLGYNRLVQRGDFAVTHFENSDRVPYGAVDRQVGVIRLTDEQQKIRAVIVNYACHPVVLGPRNLQISADYPGVMRKIVESDLG
ncbi:MAG TPA: neutral/alkaline non-lysosomal ceramidase N-terminal domain-containing protein, partial [Pirellula sp.]|nr:neutral/alkaline non-lysosomal ceramidase N-terminal domain-containing protein [Pirellula sp.]